MARIAALVVTLLALLATSFFAFSTKGKIEAIKTELEGTKTQLTAATQRATKAEANEKAAKEETAKTKADLDATKTQLASAQSDLTNAQTQITTLKGQMDDLNKQIAVLKGSTNSVVVDTSAVPRVEFDKVNAQLKEVQAQLAEANTLKETLTNKVKDAETRADGLQKEVKRYHDGTVRNGLAGEVLAVNPGWNFVVLSIGDRQGAVANAEMILTRGGSQIGRVRITSVEPSTSVADIIPGTLARGVRIQPGDRVIFPGS